MSPFEEKISRFPFVLKSYEDAMDAAGSDEWNSEELDFFLSKNCRAWFFEKHLRVERESSDQEARDINKEAIVLFEMSDVQLGELEGFEKRMNAAKKFSRRVMKCRRAQISTIWLAIDYHLIRFSQNKKGLVFADKLETSRKLRRILDIFYQSDDLMDKPEIGKKTLCEGLYLHPSGYLKSDSSHDSYILLGSGEQDNSGIGGSLDFMHWCINQDTLVQVENGRLLRAKDCVGETITTHSGLRAIVKDVSSPWTSLKNLKINIGNNSSFPVVCTPNHKFFISRGLNIPDWMEAKNIDPSRDLAVSPIRGISGGITCLSIPCIHVVKKNQPPNKPLAFFINTDFDLGRMVGLYLSEGHLKKNNSGVVFSCHSKEVSEWSSHLMMVADCFGATVMPTYGSGNRAYVSIYSKAMTVFLRSNFGEKDSKIIPDWVFDCGPDFLKGILFGYIRGDGHLEADGSLINIQSIRESSLFQMRDIVLSLYGGYGSISFREAGSYYGRNCKGIYRLCLCGVANQKIRQEFGWPLKKYARDWSGKDNWIVRNGFLYVKIKSIDAVGPAKVCDLILDHQDHSFRLPGICSHNSEAALTKDAMTHWTTISPSMKGAIFNIAESTPSMTGQDEIIFPDFEHPSEHCDCRFISWLEIKEYRIDDPLQEKEFAPHVDHNLYGKEAEIMEEHKASVPQMLWRRFKLDELKNLNSFRQVFPISKDEAFYASAGLFFHKSLVEMTKPEKQIDFRLSSFSDQGGGNISLINDPAGAWKVYENASIEFNYLIAADIAEGKCADKDGRDPDYSVAIVFKLSNPIREVAILRERIPPEILAEQIAAAAQHYGNAMVVPERNGPGLAMIVRLMQVYSNIYQNQKIQSGSFVRTMDYGFVSTTPSKVYALSCLLQQIRDKDKGRGLVLRSDIIRTEMSKFCQSGTKYSALPGYHDDTVSALWLMAACVFQTPNLLLEKDVVNEISGQFGHLGGYFKPTIPRDSWNYDRKLK